MAILGSVVCWLDQTSDGKLRQEATIAAAKEFPGAALTFCNPRYLDNPREVGTRWDRVLGIVLASSDPKVHQAYQGIKDKKVLVVVKPAAPVAPVIPVALIYLDADAPADRLTALRACAASTFPGAEIQRRPCAGFKGAEGTNIAGVVTTADQPTIIKAWKVRGVPVEVLAVGTATPVEPDAQPAPDYESAHAVLQLDEGAMRGLVGQLPDLTFLQVLADLEERTLGRLWVHEILHERLEALGEVNQHIAVARGRGPARDAPSPGPGSPVDRSQAPGEGNTPAPGPEPQEARGAWLVTHSVRGVERTLEAEPFSVDELLSALAAEEAGERRSTVIRSIQKRLDLIASGDDSGVRPQPGS